MQTDLRKWMRVVSDGLSEAKSGKPIGKKPVSLAWDVACYNKPSQDGGRVLHRTTIHAASDAINAKIKIWMDEIGRDPEDEDDLSCIEWHVAED